MTRPELLAPAGGWEALVAAVQNGADAVYLGGRRFSARAGAENFDDQQLARAVEYCHVRGVRVYVTVNTLVADTELDEAARFLFFLYNAGVDAVILQDVGLVRLAARFLPELEIHASTQMTVHNVAGALLLRDLGIKRIVLARELSLQEIESIKAGAGVEVEVFVHGALCISYSGQCLMSSLIGGRSGNRGRCAQPCRLPYQLVDKDGRRLADQSLAGAYLLSPRDLNLSRRLPDLIRAGVDCLKIEGRMKRPEYVATVVRVYHAALGRAGRGQEPVITAEEEGELAQIFNRDFTTGYFYGNQGRDLMSYKRPNNRGVRLGRVRSYDRLGQRAEILLEAALRPGDGIEFWVSEGGRVGLEVREVRVAGRPVEEAASGEVAELDVKGKIHPGDRVFKTHDLVLMDQARATFASSRETRKTGLTFKVTAREGEPLQIRVKDPDGNYGEARGTVPAEAAVKRPLTGEFLREQLDRLGNTPYTLEKLDLEDLAAGIMVPVREINEVRRLALEELSLRRANRRGRAPVPESQLPGRLKAALPPAGILAGDDPGLLLSVTVPDLAGLRAGLQGGADIICLGGDEFHFRPPLTAKDIQAAAGLCREHGAKLIIAAPRIVHSGELDRVEGRLRAAAGAGAGGVLTGNLGVLYMVRDQQLLPVYGDFGLNVFNRQAVMFLIEQGLQGFTLSPELTMEQLGPLTGLGLRAEAIVHGALPLMVSNYCAPGSLLGGAGQGGSCSGPCSSWLGGLKDRKGIVFPVEVDRQCRMHIFNSRDLCLLESVGLLADLGVRVLRVEARKEKPAYIEHVVAAYRRAIDRYLEGVPYAGHLEQEKEKLARFSPDGFTRGHYYRGVME
ncbi:MAG: DUF3656 domain-containing protein [Bacillota bacterium]